MNSNDNELINNGLYMRLEVLVAAPPTSKCKQIIAFLKSMTEKSPGLLKVDIYYAGMQLTIKPTRGYQVEGKMKKVPCLFVNGVCVANGVLPNFEELESVIKTEISKGPGFWEQ